MTRVVHLTSVHPADDNRIIHKECRALAERGYEVILIASRGDEPSVPGVEIRKVPSPKSRFDRVTRTVPQVLRAALRADADLYHLHDPELLPIGLILKARGKRVVYDAHEDLPKQVQMKAYLPTSVRRLLPSIVRFVEEGIARTLDGVITATERIADKFGRPHALAVQNFPRLDEYPRTPPAYETRRSDMAYVGSLEDERGLGVMLEVARLLAQRHPATRLVLAGRASEETRLRNPALERDPSVRWLGFQHRADVSSLLQSVKIGLCLLQPTASYLEALPTKVFEYMAAGVVTVCSDFPQWRELFEDAAVYVDPTKPDLVVDAVNRLFDEPARAAAIAGRAVRLAQTRYNWDVEADKLGRFYERCLAA